MAASLVFSEKLRRPTPVALTRARLESPLLADDGPALTLVCAPAGSGKSTLLAKVAAAATVPVAWYRVTADDMTPDTFLAHLGVTLARCFAGDGPTGNGVEALLAAVSPTQRGLLIIDDLHEASGSAADAALETFLSLRPRSLRVILGSRRAPEFNLPMLRATGAIHEIDSDDLRFRVWEVEELFTLVHHEPLPPETAAALTRRTGGWAAGLQLFHLANARKSGLARQQAVSALGPRARLIRTYLARNVLDGLPQERRRFLVRTCALGLLSGPLCDELLQTSGSADVLEGLERDQVFTSSTDDGVTYRYHEVLQRHLELTLLQECGIDDTRRWYERCAQLLLRAGTQRDALRAYAMAEDWQSIALLVQGNSADTTTAITAEPARLLPAQLLQDDPWLALAEARRRLRHGSLEQAIAGFRHAETLLDDPDFQRSCADERRVAAVWLPGILSSTDPRDPAIAWARRLRAATRTRMGARGSSAPPPRGAPDPLPARTALVVGLEALLFGDFEAAAAHFAEVVASTRAVTMTRLSASLGAVVADLAGRRGGQYVERLEEITVDAAEGGYPWVDRLARGVLAAVLAVSSQAPWRLDTFAELLVECDRAGDSWGAAMLQLASAVAGAQISHPMASGRFDDAARRFEALDAGVLTTWARKLATSSVGPASRAAEPRWAVRATPAVRLVCFGGFRVLVADVQIDLGELRPRPLALLRLLALEHGRNVHRERLIDLLWPDATVTVGTRRLQVAVSSVRHAFQQGGLGDHEVVRRAGDSYRLELGDVDVDVHQFERMLATAAAERDHVGRRIELREHALGRYVGELFPEEGSADHFVDERDRLRLVAADAACALGRDHASVGDLPAAVVAARRALELDRYRDIAWKLLADSLLAAGDHIAATKTRIEHARVRCALDDQAALGVPERGRQVPMPNARARVERTLSVR